MVLPITCLHFKIVIGAISVVLNIGSVGPSATVRHRGGLGFENEEALLARRGNLDDAVRFIFTSFSNFIANLTVSHPSEKGGDLPRLFCRNHAV